MSVLCMAFLWTADKKCLKIFIRYSFTGSINATVHRELIKEHAEYFHAGTIVVLRQASSHLSFVVYIWIVVISTTEGCCSQNDVFCVKNLFMVVGCTKCEEPTKNKMQQRSQTWSGQSHHICNQKHLFLLGLNFTSCDVSDGDWWCDVNVVTAT